ncbi:MAG: hypothetical protein AB6733_22000 [Clostridiaceae bacterium]
MKIRTITAATAMLVLLAAVFTGCVSTTENKTENTTDNTTEKTMTLSNFAENNNALVGNIGTAYIYDSDSGEDSMSIVSITTHEKFTDEAIGNDEYSNAIVIEFTGNGSAAGKLTSKVYDKDGNEITNFSARIFGIPATSKNYLMFYTDNSTDTSLTGAKYILIDGFNTNKNNGKSRIVFELAK